MFKIYADLTKLGIVIFVLLSGLAGYATSFSVEQPFSWHLLLKLLAGLYFLCSGSLALNQVQEWPRDQKMPRTAKRPIASGQIKPLAAAILSVIYIAVGSELLFETSVTSGILGLLSVGLYNGLYVYWWKPRWAFAAIPGAIPGALPITIGYVANNSEFWQTDSIYLFLILFLWQMPHFWALAIKFKDEYAAAGFPVLPVVVGVERTLYHTGLWTFLYLGVAVSAPLFVHTNWVYLLIVIPLSAKILQEFFRFFKSKGEHRWLAFFLWVNVSVIIYIFIPAIDKWSFLLTTPK